MRESRMILLVACLTLMIGRQDCIGQTIKEGHLTMTLADVQVEKPEMQQMATMMQGSTQEIFFTQEKQKVKIGMMGGMMNIMIFQDFGDKLTETYIDMMGQKIKTTLDEKALKAQEEEAAELMASSEVEYDRSDRKTIIGFECHKATLKLNTGGASTQLDFYVTDGIKVPQNFIQNLSQVAVEGTPLEMTISVPGAMKMTYVATRLEKSVPGDFYQKPAGTYTEMSAEDLKKMGLGGGFGF